MDAWSTFYGLSTLAAILLALSTNRPGPVMCGMFLLADWLGTCVATVLLGFQRAPMVIAPLDATIGILVFSVGVRFQCRIGLQVFGLFLIGGCIHVASYLTGTWATRPVYEALNVVFFLAVLTVAWPGAVDGLHRWADRLHHQPRAAHSSR